MKLGWIVCAVSLGGLLFGFVSGVISGCEETIQREFALSPFWHGLVVSGWKQGGGCAQRKVFEIKFYLSLLKR